MSAGSRTGSSRRLPASASKADGGRGRIGIWVTLDDGSEAKIAAIGVRVRRWISFHGISLNVEPDLGHFTGIVPCGLAQFGVTSLRRLGVGASLAEVDDLLAETFASVFAAQ